MGDTTSAVPANLQEFVSGGGRLRSPLSTTQSSLASLQRSVLAASPDYGVATSTLPAVEQLLGDLETNETYVSTIRERLLAADTGGGSTQVTVSNASIQVALAEANVSTGAPPPITVGQTQMYGLPPTSGFVDDPICAANGNFVHDDLDLAHPGWSAVLDVRRTYNSLAAATAAVDTSGAFGPGWTSVLDLRLAPAGDGIVWVHLADGAIVPFVARAGESEHHVVGPRPLHVTQADDGTWILREGHVKRWTFSADGTFTGGTAGPATLSIERDGTGRIVRLAEARSGRSVTYEWDDDHVVAATTSDGRAATYTYESGVLVHVDRPAGAIDFGVDGTLVVDVTDADGVRLASNVYDDAGRVIEQTNELGRTTRYDYSEHGTTLVSDTVDGPRNAFTHDHRGNLTAMVDGHGAAMRLTYDDADRVTRVVDRTGAVTTHTFDERSNLTTRTDADGLGQAWAWDDQDRLVAETHRNGGVTTYAYEGTNRQPSLITGPDGATIEITVDAGTDKPLQMVDADGVRATFEHDVDGQLVAATDGLGRRTTIRYDAAGLPVETIDATGGVTRLTNDDGGRLVESIIGDDVIRFAYTAAGRPLSGIDAVGQSWTATFGDHGHLATFTDGEGSTVGYEWDLFGNVAAVVAPDGQRFEHRYDEANQLVGAVDPAGNESRRELDAEGRVVAVTDPLGNRWQRELDVLGRTRVSIAPDGARTRYEYDALGLVARVVQPDGHVVSAEHDVAGRVTAVVDELAARYEYRYTPAGRLAERRWPSGRIERWTYDGAGRVASHEADGIRTELEVDALGRIVEVSGPDGQVRAERSPNGDLLGLSDAVSSERFEVDAAGRVVGAVDGTGHRSTYAWDARGQLAAATDPAGLVSSLGYDVRGRQAAQVNPGGDEFRFGYDPVGWLTSASDPTGVTTNRRDASGRVVGIDRPGLPSVDLSLDAIGRTIGVAVGGQLDRTFGYDGRGRLSEAVQVADDVRTTFGWDPVGRLAEVDGPSGRLVAERDADGRLSAWTEDGARTGIRRDQRGRVIGLDDSVLGSLDPPPPLGVQRDLAGRVTSDDRGATYRYDDAGRLAEALSPTGRRWVYRYGDDGLLAAELGPDGEVVYRRGLMGRVDATVHPDGTETRFAYDARGRRVETNRPDGTATRYRWDDADRLTGLERTSPDGQIERHQIVVDALGRPVSVDDQPVLWDDLRSGLPLTVAGARYLHLDGRSRIAESGSSWSEPTDDPWGVDDVVAPHAGFRNELAGFGLVWLGARVYDPATREFLSPDPLLAVPGQPGAASAYTYGFLDPINFLDPSGLRPISQQEWESTRQRQEQGNLGAAWEAIKSDPWGTLAMVGVAAVGVGLCFVPGGQAIGVGILIGVGTSAAAGLATGTFNPRGVAVSGAFGAIPGGSTLRSAMLVGAASGVGAEATTQLVTNGRIDPSSLGPAALLGAGGGALGHGINTHFGGTRAPVDAPAAPTTTAPPARFAVGSDGVATDLTRPQFNTMYDGLDSLDVATPRNGSVYYSGPGNRDLAESFALDNGRSTLEMTPGGRWLDDQKLFENPNYTNAEATAVWNHTSERFAQSASGNAVAFVNGARAESIFNTVEYPALRANPDVTNVITGGH